MGMVEEAEEPIKYICSVCIANYNGIGYIDRCLQSVMDQDCLFPVEIIVHDDASTDSSVAFIQEKYPHVNLIPSEENVGFCIANNRMVKAAKGEYILLLNNDAELFPDALRLLFEHAFRSDRPSILSIPQYNAETGELIDRGEMLDLFLNPVPNSKCQDVGMVIGACLWISKQLWNELGGFPDWFHSIAEDMYLCCAARLKGYAVQVLQKSGYRHWVGASFGGGKVRKNRLSTSVRRRVLSERNKTFVMMICFPFPCLLLIFPLHLFLLFCEGSAIAFLKRDFGIFKRIYVNILFELCFNMTNIRSSRKIRFDNISFHSVHFFRIFRLTPAKLTLLTKYGWPAIR